MPTQEAEAPKELDMPKITEEPMSQATTLPLSQLQSITEDVPQPGPNEVLPPQAAPQQAEPQLKQGGGDDVAATLHDIEAEQVPLGACEGDVDMGKASPEGTQQETLGESKDGNGECGQSTTPQEPMPATGKAEEPAQISEPADKEGGSTEPDPKTPMDSAALLETLCTHDPHPEVTLHRIDDLISAVGMPGYESEKAALSLSLCLLPDFDSGLGPGDFSVLLPSVLSWMKQIAQTPCGTMWDHTTQRCLNAFEAMRRASESMQEKLKTTHATKAAASSAALRSYNDTVQQVASRPQAAKAAILDSKASVLCKWLASRHRDLRVSLEQSLEKHAEAIKLFEAEVGWAVSDSYEQWKAAQEIPAVCEADLFQHLDGELEDALRQQTAPEQVDKVPDVPEKVADPATEAAPGIQATEAGHKNQQLEKPLPKA